MMDNFARIISHGFAIVVVILLGIGFIYRGELFPDLELPDFLVPDSGKMADAGDHMDKRQTSMAVTQGKAAGEPVETASAPIAPIVEAPATAPEAGAGTPGAAPTDVTSEAIAARSAPQETAETGIVTGTEVESLQAPTEEVPPPPAAEPETAESASTGVGEASSATATGSIAVPVPSRETPVEPPVEVRGSGTGTQPAAAAEETSTEPGIPPETEPQTGSRIPVEGEVSNPVPAPEEVPAPTTGMAVPGSTPVTAAEMQPGVSAPGQSPGVTSAVKPYELLAAAREAFWLHNYDDAEKNYRALTELEPQNPDGYGELGNMYFSQGRWEEAAAAYYEAGTRLISEGRLDPARELVTVIRGLNGKQADELSKLINSAASTGND